MAAGLKNFSREVRAKPRRLAAGTRGRIMAAAEESFAIGGLAGARTEQIAVAAGVNKAMLYYYFKSKERLYEAVVEEQFKGFHEQAMRVLEREGAARELLMEYVGVHFDFMAGRQRYASLYQQMMVSGGKAKERIVKKYFLPRSEALRRLLERGMREGDFRKADAMHTAVSITSLIVFYFSAAPVLKLLGHHDAYTEANLQRRRKEVFAFIRQGLFMNPEAT